MGATKWEVNATTLCAFTFDLPAATDRDEVATEARRRGATQAVIALVGDDGDVLEEYDVDEWCESCDGPLFYGDDDWRFDTEDAFAAHAHGSPRCVPRTRAYAELEQVAGIHVAVDDGRVVLELLIPGVPYASRVQYLDPEAAALLVEHLRIATARACRGARVSNALEGTDA